MCTLNKKYRTLLSKTINVVDYDEYPIHLNKYRASRNGTIIHLNGIKYDMITDSYEAYIRVSVVGYRRHKGFTCVIDAIIDYDNMIKQSRGTFVRKNNKPYVLKGKLLYNKKVSKKKLTQSDKIFIDNHYEHLNYTQLSKFLMVDPKQIYSYIHRTKRLLGSIKDINKPMVILWDVRNKFEVDKRELLGEDELEVTDEALDAFLGI